MTHLRSTLARAGRLAPVLLALALGTGCVSRLDYTPRTNLVAEAGSREALADELEEVMTRAIAPRVVEVEVEDKSLTYSYTGVHWGWYVGPHEGRQTIYYNNLEEVQIYENNKVFLNGSGGQRLAEVVFNDTEDAKRFADLLWSLKLGGDAPAGERADDASPAEEGDEPAEEAGQEPTDETGEEESTRDLLDEDG